jgi:hypothetical protein
LAPITWHCDRRISGAEGSIRYGATSPHTLGTPSQPSAGVSPAPEQNKLNIQAGISLKKLTKRCKRLSNTLLHTKKYIFLKKRSIRNLLKVYI